MAKLSIKSNSLWNIGNYGFSIVSLFFLFPFMIRHLGDSNYGFFIFLGTINGMANIANFGFGEATLRFIALYHNTCDSEKLIKILSTSFWTYFVLGSITTLCIIVFANPIVGLLHETQIDKEFAIYLVKISAFTFLIRFVMGIYSTIPQAIQRFDISSKIAISETVLRVALYIVVLFLDYGLEGIVFSELALAIIVSLANILISSKLLNSVAFFIKPSISAFKEIFNYSIFSFLTQLVGLLWQYSDRILLGYFIGTAAIAYFSVPQQIIFKILGLVAAASAVLLPRFSMNKIDEPSKKLYKEFTLLSLLFSILVFSTLSLVIKDFIALWISPSFAKDTKYIAVILSISCMIRGAFPIYESLFKGIGKPVYNMYIIIASSLIIVVLDIILIPLIGINGAGIAYLASPIAGVVAMVFIWKKILLNRLSEPIKFYLIPLLSSYALLGMAFYVKSSINFAPSWITIFVQVFLYGIAQIILTGAYYKFFVPEVWNILIKLLNRSNLLYKTIKITPHA